MTYGPVPQKRSCAWGWLAVPVGCVVALICFVAFPLLIVTFVFSLMKSSDAYKEAVEMASANTAVIEALGTPIKEGFFVTGNIHTGNKNGNADLSIPISGPQGKARINLVATKAGGEWTYSVLTVTIKSTGAVIDLLDLPAESTEPRYQVRGDYGLTPVVAGVLTSSQV